MLSLLLHEDAAHAVLQAAALHDVLHSRVSLRDVLHSRASLRDVLHSRVFAALHDVLHMPHQARRGQEEVVGEVVGDVAWPPSEP